MVICLEQDADLHMAQLMPLPLTVSCFSKIQIGFNFLVPAHLGSPGKRAVKQVCGCVCVTGILCLYFDYIYFNVITMAYFIFIYLQILKKLYLVHIYVFTDFQFYSFML